MYWKRILERLWCIWSACCIAVCIERWISSVTVLALSVQEPFLLTSEILPSIILGHLSQSSTWSCCDISLSIFTSSVSSSCCQIKSPVCVQEMSQNLHCIQKILPQLVIKICEFIYRLVLRERFESMPWKSCSETPCLGHDLLLLPFLFRYSKSSNIIYVNVALLRRHLSSPAGASVV